MMITEADVSRFASRINGPVRRMKTKDIVESITGMKREREQEKDFTRKRKLTRIIKDMYSVLRVIRKIKIKHAKAA